ncbi:MAG: HAMP domain-containing protein [Candidatus Muiribacteriota bacterium]
MHIRKNYFVDKGFQTEIIFALLFLTFFIIFITFFNLYFFVEYFTLNVLEPEEYKQFTLLLSKAWTLLSDKIFFLLFIDFLIIVFVGLFLSHQIAGPGFKLKKSINKIADGNLNFKVKLRQGDKFVSMAESLNYLIEKYQNRFKSLKFYTAKLKDSIIEKKDKEALENLGEIEKNMDEINF